jgi:hypothetical protein
MALGSATCPPMLGATMTSLKVDRTLSERKRDG